MFGFSWAEILLTSAIALVVIGPKDIPKVMFQVGRLVRRAQYLKFAMSRQFEDFLKEHDLDLNDPRHINFETRGTDALMTDQEYLPPVAHYPSVLRGEDRVAGSGRPDEQRADLPTSPPSHPPVSPEGRGNEEGGNAA